MRFGRECRSTCECVEQSVVCRILHHCNIDVTRSTSFLRFSEAVADSVRTFNRGGALLSQVHCHRTTNLLGSTQLLVHSSLYDEHRHHVLPSELVPIYTYCSSFVRAHPSFRPAGAGS